MSNYPMVDEVNRLVGDLLAGSGEVFLPARTLRQAAKRIGTPFYVYDEAGLRQNAAVARAAFSWNAGFALWFPLRWLRL